MLRLSWGDTVTMERHCETDEERKALRAAKRIYKIKQIGGDDGYQWVVMKRGIGRMNGLTKREAEHEVDRLRRAYVTEVTA